MAYSCEEPESSEPAHQPEGEIIGIHRADHDPPPLQETPSTYFMRVDQDEVKRLILQSDTIDHAMQDLLPRAIDPFALRSVLDVACGPGGWTRALALLYPHLSIEGFDNNHLIVAHAMRLAREANISNVHYQLGDILTGPLPYADGSFDVVNARFITSFVHRRQWPTVIKEFFRVTRPGGWIVITDGDSVGTSSSLAFRKFTDAGLKAMQRAGHYAGSQGVTIHLRHFLKKVGCINEQMEPYLIDYSADRPHAHQAIAENLKVAMLGFRPFAVTKGKFKPEDYDALYAQFLREIEHPDFHGVWTIYRAWGQKPL